MCENINMVNPQEEIDPLGSLPVDRDKLSKESKRTAYIPDRYTSRNDVCIGCGVKMLFSAEEQKKWYEEYKMYIHSTRSRCSTCQEKWKDLKNEVLEMPARLRGQCDLVELERMLVCITQLDSMTISNKLDNALTSRIYNKVFEIERKSNIELGSSALFERIRAIE